MTALSPCMKIPPGFGPSPLPGLLPLGLFTRSFPRDRLDLRALTSMLPFTVKGPVIKEGFRILQLEPEAAFPASHTRAFNGSEKPKALRDSFISWKGILLGRDDNIPQGGTKEAPPVLYPRISSSYIGLYKLVINPERLWWEDLSIKEVWRIRVPRSKHSS